MKKVKTIFVFILLSCFYSKLYSQFAHSKYYYSYDNPVQYEIGAGIGLMNCITDIGGANGDKTYYLNEMRLKNFKPDVSVYGSVVYHNFIGARIEGTWGQITSADGDIKSTTFNSHSREVRNLSFKSRIYECSLLFEFRPLSLINSQEDRWLVQPYVTTGIGVFSFNPQTKYNGDWVDLKPLHTEGEGFPEYPGVSNYKLLQANIPVGIGLFYNLSSKFNVRLEYLHRVLFTDYLDDVSSKKFIKPAAFDKNLSPVFAADAKALYNRSKDVRISVRRGNPNNNDTYMSFSVKVGLILGAEFRR